MDRTSFRRRRPLADTYLNEEIRAEALTRNVGAFSRFLEVAARQNGQVTNMANLSREAAVGRTTVQNYLVLSQGQSTRKRATLSQGLDLDSAEKPLGKAVGTERLD